MVSVWSAWGARGRRFKSSRPDQLLPVNLVHPYSEKIIRHRAINEEGKVVEVLERITYERQPPAGTATAELTVVNRRFDLRTGEQLNRLSDTEFEEGATGARLHLQP